MEWISLAVSVVALGISAGLGFRGYRLQKRLAAIEQERRTEELAARGMGDVTAYFTWHDRGSSLVLENRGQGQVIDVDFDFVASNGKDKIDPRLMLVKESFPLSTLDAGAKFVLPAQTTGATPLTLHIRFWWEDGWEGSRLLSHERLADLNRSSLIWSGIMGWRLRGSANPGSLSVDTRRSLTDLLLYRHREAGWFGLRWRPPALPRCRRQLPTRCRAR